jgi:hypothetical protein
MIDVDASRGRLGTNIANKKAQRILGRHARAQDEQDNEESAIMRIGRKPIAKQTLAQVIGWTAAAGLAAAVNTHPSPALTMLALTMGVLFLARPALIQSANRLRKARVVSSSKRP